MPDFKGCACRFKRIVDADPPIFGFGIGTKTCDPDISDPIDRLVAQTNAQIQAAQGPGITAADTKNGIADTGVIKFYRNREREIAKTVAMRV